MGRKSLPPNAHSALLFPTPVVLVTCVDEGGKPNIITLALAGGVNLEPPMVGISIRPSRYSYECIKRSKEFVVNLPSEEMAQGTDACGILSGRETDKFALMGWRPVPAQVVKPPLIDQSPAQMECRLKQIVPLGSHDLFIGEIVALHVKEEFLKEHERMDLTRVLPLVYCPSVREYWGLGKLLGRFGFSKGKP